jgi:hypothetical protein
VLVDPKLLALRVTSNADTLPRLLAASLEEQMQAITRLNYESVGQPELAALVVNRSGLA